MRKDERAVEGKGKVEEGRRKQGKRKDGRRGEEKRTSERFPSSKIATMWRRGGVFAILTLSADLLTRGCSLTCISRAER